MVVLYFWYNEHNINLVFYFDGSSGTEEELQKQLCSISRREDDIDDLMDLETYVNNPATTKRPKVC